MKYICLIALLGSSSIAADDTKDPLHPDLRTEQLKCSNDA